jgi:hypothetical protein
MTEGSPIVHGTARAKAIADARELFALVGLYRMTCASRRKSAISSP